MGCRSCFQGRWRVAGCHWDWRLSSTGPNCWSDSVHSMRGSVCTFGPLAAAERAARAAADFLWSRAALSRFSRGWGGCHGLHVPRIWCGSSPQSRIVSSTSRLKHAHCWSRLCGPHSPKSSTKRGLHSTLAGLSKRSPCWDGLRFHCGRSATQSRTDPWWSCWSTRTRHRISCWSPGRSIRVSLPERMCSRMNCRCWPPRNRFGWTI